MIVSSIIMNQVPQIDGRIDVTELHTHADGRTEIFNYLADADLNLQAVADQRAANINAALVAQEAAIAAATQYEIPLTPVEVMRRLSPSEWAAFQASTDTTIAYFRAIFDKTTVIYRNDALTQAGFNALVSAGILSSGRVDEVLA